MRRGKLVAVRFPVELLRAVDCEADRQVRGRGGRGLRSYVIVRAVRLGLVELAKQRK